MIYKSRLPLHLQPLRQPQYKQYTRTQMLTRHTIVISLSSSSACVCLVQTRPNTGHECTCIICFCFCLYLITYEQLNRVVTLQDENTPHFTYRLWGLHGKMSRIAGLVLVLWKHVSSGRLRHIWLPTKYGVSSLITRHVRTHTRLYNFRGTAHYYST